MHIPVWCIKLHTPRARPCSVLRAAHTLCISLLGAWSCKHTVQILAWCTELHYTLCMSLLGAWSCTHIMHMPAQCTELHTPDAHPCLVPRAAHTQCPSLSPARSCSHPVHVPALCSELLTPSTCPCSVHRAAQSTLWSSDGRGGAGWLLPLERAEKAAGFRAGDASCLVEVASIFSLSVQHHPTDGEMSGVARTQQSPFCWDFTERSPTKMPFPMGPTFLSPAGTPPPHIPSGSPGLPTSLPAAVTSRNIFRSSCRRRGDAWPAPRSRPRNAEQSSPPTPGISDVPAQWRFGMATAAWPRWGHGRTCPVNPIPTSTSHSHLSACWGLELVLGPAMGTVSCCLSPAGLGGWTS